MFSFVFSTLIVFSCLVTTPREIPDYKQLYDKYQVTGTFVLLNVNTGEKISYNEKDNSTGYLPASTFKIINSMIGLETGVIKNENHVIPWDKKERSNANWNSDTDLKTAYKNSTVWYYQELARRVGEKKMRYWVKTCDYGNRDIRGGIDRFWLNGNLRISPNQQVEFLVKLVSNKLPFSNRTTDLVKKIMIAEETPDYVLRAKTGWGFDGVTDIGWYAGYVTTKENTYVFANCIQSTDQNQKDFGKARIEITREILKDQGIIKL